MFDIRNPLRYITMMATEYNVNYIWDSLADFWKLFDDAPVIDQLWRGYVFTINNLYYQLYQLNLSKCVHTIPHEWISDWELFVFNDTTIPDPNTHVFPEYSDYPYVYRLPFGVKNVSKLRESPRETIVLPNNTILGPDDILVLPDGTRRYLGDTYYYPEEVIEWDDYLVFPAGIMVDVIDMVPVDDYVVDEPSKTIHFKRKPYTHMWSNLAIRDLEMIYENFGCLLKYYKPDSYKYLREVQGLWYAYWNGAAIDNIEIGLNILRDLPFVQEDGVIEGVEMHNAVATIGDHNILLNTAQLELINEGSTVTSVDPLSGVVTIGNYPFRFKPQDAAELEIGDTVLKVSAPVSKITVNGTEYVYHGESSIPVVVGEFVSKFKPLTDAVRVYDYINYPGWWKEYIGEYTDNFKSCALDGSAHFDSNSIFDIGIFDASMTERCLQALFLQYFTFLVRIDSKAWFCTKSELDVVVAFLHAIKPAYTHFLFEFSLNFQDDTYVFDEEFKFDAWEFRPTDIPVDHHIFDMEAIHPTFDDDSEFDFENQRDLLCISIFGSPHIFIDDIISGYTFDDVAVPDFDYKFVGFDSDPLNDTLDFEITRRVPSNLEFANSLSILDSELSNEV